jgi:hypothetical protein
MRVELLDVTFSPFLLAALVSLSQPAAEAPVWSAPELKQLFARISAAGNLPPQQYTAEMAAIGGIAYRVPATPNESPDLYAKRVLKKREPAHPNVKAGQWVLALTRTFYSDVSKRCEGIARFEKDRNERNYFDRMAKETKTLADQFAKDVQTAIEGVPGFTSPPPNAAECDEVTGYGAQVTVRSGVIGIENLDRATFVNDAPKDDAPRTGRGSLREIFSAFDQYNRSAAVLSPYESSWRKNRGNFRMTIPADAPAIYLNELILGAIEADMALGRLMVMGKGNKLCELRLPLKAVKPAKSKKKAQPAGPAGPAIVKCPSEVTMQRCVEHIVEAKKAGAFLFKVE